MAYDPALAERVRTLLAPIAPHTEKAMFGGLAFLVEDRMALAADSAGGLMVRVDRDRLGALDGPHVAPMHMRGRAMRGWSTVDATALADDETLRAWVELGVDGARRVARA